MVIAVKYKNGDVYNSFVFASQLFSPFKVNESALKLALNLPCISNAHVFQYAIVGDFLQAWFHRRRIKVEKCYNLPKEV